LGNGCVFVSIKGIFSPLVRAQKLQKWQLFKK